MNAVGIIAEYNPFHNGHAWHVNQARELSGCNCVIAVMSGHFLQRGEPASFDKWMRAKMAIMGGVDLVIELPTAFTVRSAQYFAAGGVRLLGSLGIVSHLCFGAENSNLDELKQAAASIGLERTVDALRFNMSKGYTYAKAVSHSVSQVTGIDSSTLSSPNNILAIEYLRAISRYAPSILPVPVKRKSSNYHDTEISSEFASATAIRQSLEKTGTLDSCILGAIPETTADCIKSAIDEGSGPVRFESFAPALLYLLRTLAAKELEQIAEITEGIHHKILSSALKAGSVEQLLTLIKSKRYTRTRLQRILIHSLLGTKRVNTEIWDETGPPYARILAFNDCGREMLQHISVRSSLSLVTKTAKVINTRQIQDGNSGSTEKMLALDLKASDIFALGMPNPQFRCGGWDFLRSPQYVPSRRSVSAVQE